MRYDHDVSIFRKLGSNVLKMDHRFLAPAGPNVSFSSDLGPLRGPLMSSRDLIDILVYSGVLGYCWKGEIARVSFAKLKSSALRASFTKLTRADA